MPAANIVSSVRGKQERIARESRPHFGYRPAPGCTLVLSYRCKPPFTVMQCQCLPMQQPRRAARERDKRRHAGRSIKHCARLRDYYRAGARGNPVGVIRARARPSPPPPLTVSHLRPSPPPPPPIADHMTRGNRRWHLDVNAPTMETPERDTNLIIASPSPLRGQSRFTPRSERSGSGVSGSLENCG